MKIPKLLTICLVVCCFLTSSVFAAFHGLGVAKTAESLGGAKVISVGQTVYFRVRLTNNVDTALDTIHVLDIQDTTYPYLQAPVVSPLYPVSDFDWLFEAGAGWNDDITKDYIIIPPGGVAEMLTQADSGYVVQASDLEDPDGVINDIVDVGFNDECDGIPTGDCSGPGVYLRNQGAAALPLVGPPCVNVVKTACPYSKVGDTVTYDITINNCGDQDLVLNSVTDSLLGDITAAALAANCDPLPVGGSCNFQVQYEVQPGDDSGPGTILVNVVEVNYTSSISQEIVTDDDDAVVTLLHPSFTLDVECLEIVNSTALFQADFCNTGDVGLLVDPADPDIGAPFELPVPIDGECSTFIIEVPVEAGVCGAATASKTISALASIIMPPDTPAECQLGNIIEPVPAEDTATCTANVNPSFTAEKVCLDITPLAVADGFADYQINFANTSTGDVPVELLFEIDDPAAGYFAVLGPLAPGGSDSVIVQVPVSVQVGCPAPAISNTATVTGICLVDGTRLDPLQVDAECPGPCADFTVEKICLTDGGLMDGDLAQYEIVITNTGDVPLDLVIDDPSAEPPLIGVVVPLAAGDTYNTTVSRTVVCAEPGNYMIDNTVSVVAVAPDGTQIGPKEATAECPYECGGAEGCTPGFWKNHPACWCDSYTPDMLASDVFTRLASAPYDTLGDDEKPLKSNFEQDTLLDALKYRGGPDLAGSVRNMLRHATSALLNGCSNDVFYPVSDLTVIDLVNNALDTEDPAVIQDLHSLLASFNEDYPCPINAHCERTDVIIVVDGN